MTKQEKIIVSAYTGYLMCKFEDLHKYVEEALGRPVFTHELADEDVIADIREAIKPEFNAVCHDLLVPECKTQGDRVRLMSDKELGWLLSHSPWVGKEKDAIEWLGKEVQ